MPAVEAALRPIERVVNKTTVRLEQGDLTAMEVDAVVFYAREDLELGSGFGTAIQSRGGGGIKKELAALGRVKPGEAVITSGGNLNASHIIHACGPKFQEQDTELKLRDTMLASLRLAAAEGLKSIAFPPMGAGFYGVPLELCARVMTETISEFARRDGSLETVIVCAGDRREYAAFETKVASL